LVAGETGPLESGLAGETACPTLQAGTLLAGTLLAGLLIVAMATLASCGRPDRVETLTPVEFAAMRWEDVTLRARGSEVALGMWAGDEDRNRFFRSTVTRQLKDELGISLRIVPLGDTAEAVNKLLNEKGAGKAAGGSIDIVWINGENFRTAKQAASCGVLLRIAFPT